MNRDYFYTIWNMVCFVLLQKSFDEMKLKTTKIHTSLSCCSETDLHENKKTQSYLP